MNAVELRSRMLNLFDERELQAYKIIKGFAPPTETMTRDKARKIFAKTTTDIARYSYLERIAMASLDEDTPVEAQKDLIQYILPKAPKKDTLHIDADVRVTPVLTPEQRESLSKVAKDYLLDMFCKAGAGDEEENDGDPRAA